MDHRSLELLSLKMAQPEDVSSCEERRMVSVSPATTESERSPVSTRQCSEEKEPATSTKESESKGIRAATSSSTPIHSQDKLPAEVQIRIAHGTEEIGYKGTTAAVSNRQTKRERTPDEEPARRVAQRTEPVQVSESASHVIMAKLILEDLWCNDVRTLEMATKRLGQYLYRPGSDDANFAKTQKVFFQVGGHLAVVRVMKHNPNHKMLQIRSLGLLWNAAVDNPKYQTTIAMAEGMHGTLAAMMKFPYDKFITHLGFGALHGMTCDHRANADLLVRSIGGIPFLLEQMRAFKDNQHVMLRACQMLGNFCRRPALRHLMFEANAVTALAAAIDGHKDNPHIQEAARSAMKRLVVY